MAFPKKSGLRRITVENVVYRWRFSGGELQDALTIYGPNSSGRALVVKSYQWFDLWVSYPFALHLRQSPEIVTPSVVRRAIEFALDNGWNPTLRGEKLIFWYSNSEFQTTAPNAEAIRETRKSQFEAP